MSAGEIPFAGHLYFTPTPFEEKTFPKHTSEGFSCVCVCFQQHLPESRRQHGYTQQMLQPIAPCRDPGLATGFPQVGCEVCWGEQTAALPGQPFRVSDLPLGRRSWSFPLFPHSGVRSLWQLLKMPSSARAPCCAADTP